MEVQLNHIIHTLTKDEVRYFKLFSDRYANDSDRKDISLFDYIRKAGERYNEEKIVKTLYGTGDKNSFYRLRNRLLSDLNKSLVTQYYNDSDSNAVLYLILLSRIFREKRDFNSTYYFLKKAEKKAKSLSANEMLDVIYGEMIRISTETLEVDPEEYIRLRKENREILKGLQEIDDILAVLMYRIRVSQNFGSGTVEVAKLLDRIIKDYSESSKMMQNIPFRMKVYQSVSRILLQQHDYVSLEKYLLKTYKEFSKENLFDKNNHDTKLGMLVYLVNSLFKNKKYNDSLHYAAILGKGMEEFNASHREKYLFYYYNALVNNYAVIDKQKAVEIIEDALQKPEISGNTFNRLFLDIQLALQFFDLKEFRKANKLIVRVRHEDNFKIFDQAFQLKILIAELLIRFELKDADYIESQIPKIRKAYTELLSEESYYRQDQMLHWLKRACISSNLRKDEKLKGISQQLLQEGGASDSGDNDLLDYNGWILQKTS